MSLVTLAETRWLCGLGGAEPLPTDTQTLRDLARRGLARARKIAAAIEDDLDRKENIALFDNDDDDSDGRGFETSGDAGISTGATDDDDDDADEKVDNNDAKPNGSERSDSAPDLQLAAEFVPELVPESASESVPEPVPESVPEPAPEPFISALATAATSKISAVFHAVAQSNYAVFQALSSKTLPPVVGGRDPPPQRQPHHAPFTLFD